MRLLSSSILPALLLLLAGSRPGLSAPAGEEEARVLKDAGLETDGTTLLRFFRARTPSESDRARLAGLVRDLGSRSFPVRQKASRELTAAGEAALSLLKAVLPGADLEMRRRAENCIQDIERVPHAVLAGAAARWLAIRKPEGAAETLLAYLPFADWDVLEDSLLETMATVGLKSAAPLPAIVAAATDKDVRRRAAAAHVLGYCGPTHRESLTKLLADTDAGVRYRAAAGLVRCRDERGVKGLLALLGDGPLPLAWRAEELLGQLAGDQLPAAGTAGDPAARKKWQAAWETWWTANRLKVDLAKVKLEGTIRGVTVVCEIDGVGQFPGRVTEFDRGGNLLRSLEGLDSPTGFQCLPGGRVLVAEHWADRVTERDRQGKILWEKKLDNKPVSCARLPNGNTFIATYSQILELNAAGKELLSVRDQESMIYCASKMRGGNIVYITSNGKVTELDGKGAVVRSFTPAAHSGGAGYWAGIEPLPDGRYLICLTGAGKMVETDGTGKILWECSVAGPCGATRLPNGNTLVANADGRCVVEVDRQGKEVWKKTTKGRPFTVRRY